MTANLLITDPQRHPSSIFASDRTSHKGSSNLISNLTCQLKLIHQNFCKGNKYMSTVSRCWIRASSVSPSSSFRDWVVSAEHLDEKSGGQISGIRQYNTIARMVFNPYTNSSKGFFRTVLWKKNLLIMAAHLYNSYSYIKSFCVNQLDLSSPLFRISHPPTFFHEAISSCGSYLSPLQIKCHQDKWNHNSIMVD